MNTCKVCGDVEPQDHEEFWWRCSCHDKKHQFSVDDVLKEIEDNFAELWEANK